MKKATVFIESSVEPQELRCGDYFDFYIAPISDVSLRVEDEDGEVIYEDDCYQLCPTYSIAGYEEALQNPDDEDSQECLDDYKSAEFDNCAPFLKTVWDKMPMTEAEFCRQLVQEATNRDVNVEMELSSGDDYDDQSLFATFEIDLPDGEFDVDLLSFINFDMESGDMDCAEIIDGAFTGCDKVLLNFIKYGNKFYQTCADDDGFANGCNIDEAADVNCMTLEEIR